MVIRNVELETVCGVTSTLPENTLPEFAFAGKSNVGNAGTHLKRPITPLAMNTSAVPSGPTTRVVRGAAHSARMSLNSSFSQLWEKSSGSSNCFGAAREK